MIIFPKIMETMNEKKQFFINSFPNKFIEVMKRLTFTPIVGIGHLLLQKGPSYDVIQSKRATMDKGKQIVGCTSVSLEE